MITKFVCFIALDMDDLFRHYFFSYRSRSVHPGDYALFSSLSAAAQILNFFVALPSPLPPLFTRLSILATDVKSVRQRFAAFVTVMSQRSSPPRTPRSTAALHGGARPGPSSDDMDVATPTTPPTPSKSSPARVQAMNAARAAERAHMRALEDAHGQLTGAKGRSMTFEEGRMALALMIGYQLHFEMSETHAIDNAALLLGRSDNTLRALLKHLQECNEVLVVASAHRGAGSPDHRYHDMQLESSEIGTIHRTIVSANAEGSGCRTQMVIDALKRDYGREISSRTLRRVLNRIGYQYGKAKFIGKMNREDRLQRNMFYMYEIANARNEEIAGQAVLVFNDESYINQFHSTGNTWRTNHAVWQRNVCKAWWGRGADECRDEGGAGGIL